MNFGLGEILVILVLGLVLFGAKKLPETGRALGSALKEFKKGMKYGEEDFEEDNIIDSEQETNQGDSESG